MEARPLPLATPSGTALAARLAPAWQPALLALAWLAATAGLRPLMLPDEGRYVGVAWEMLRSGDWLTPTLNGLPYFHKPPLFYWITAASMSVFGPNEWAARAAPLLGGWAGAVAMWSFARRWAGAPTATATLQALLVQPLFFLGAQFANLDMLVAGCITVAITAWADAVLRLEAGQPHRRSLAIGHGAAALGVLAKGLIGVVIPVLVLVCALVLSRRAGHLRRLAWLPGILLMLGMAAPWFIAMQWLHADFWRYFIVVQHLQRYTGGGFNNVQPFWFFPVVLALFALPWWPWLFRRGSERHFVHVLMLAWIGTVLLFFSLPASKLVGYVLPAVPPLAFLAGQGSVADGRRRWWLGALALMVAIDLTGVAVLSRDVRHTTRPLAPALRQAAVADAPIFMLGRYPFDLPVLARLPRPVAVVDDWRGLAGSRADDWHRELLDAAGFAPRRAARTLLAREDLPAALCDAGAMAWIVGTAADRAAYPFLDAAEAVAAHDGVVLWRLRLPAATLNCAGRPSGGSPGRSAAPRPAAPARAPANN